MRVHSSWAGTLIIPETKRDEKVLNRLWDSLPDKEKGYNPFPAGAIFIRNDEKSISIFISSGN